MFRVLYQLLMLGYTEAELSETTVARCLRAIRKKTGPTADQTQSWKTFHKNHRDDGFAVSATIVL